MRCCPAAALPCQPSVLWLPRGAGLVGELAEQLRLILEPTLASRLAGDYRSGKRINMKKVGVVEGWCVVCLSVCTKTAAAPFQRVLVCLCACVRVRVWGGVGDGVCVCGVCVVVVVVVGGGCRELGVDRLRLRLLRAGLVARACSTCLRCPRSWR